MKAAYALFRSILLLDRDKAVFESTLSVEQAADRLGSLIAQGLLSRMHASPISGRVKGRQVRLIQAPGPLAFRLAALQFTGTLYETPTGCKVVGEYSFTGFGRLLAGVLVGTFGVVAALLGFAAVLAFLSGKPGQGWQAAKAAGVCVLACLPIGLLAGHTRSAAAGDRSELEQAIRLTLLGTQRQ